MKKNQKKIKPKKWKVIVKAINKSFQIQTPRNIIVLASPKLHFVFKMGSIETLASSTFHDQSRQGRAHISEVSPQNGREKGGERRRDNMVRGGRCLCVAN